MTRVVVVESDMILASPSAAVLRTRANSTTMGLCSALASVSMTTTIMTTTNGRSGVSGVDTRTSIGAEDTAISFCWACNTNTHTG